LTVALTRQTACAGQCRTDRGGTMPSLSPRVDLATWDPEDPERWDSRFAWRTLWITTYNLTLAFCVWYLVSAIAPRLNDIGFDLTKAELYWLVAVPGLAGGSMRLM